MNQSVIANYARLKITFLYLPIGLLLLMAISLYARQALNIEGYNHIQKKLFFFLNKELGSFPEWMNNLTQIGNQWVFFAFFSILIIYASEIFGALIYSLLASALFVNLFKELFAVPRPAAFFDNSQFFIIGPVLQGHNSFPSGHSATIFVTITVLMFAFFPKSLKYKIAWFFSLVSIGLLLAATRIGVGAHYPLDVFTGSVLGYISGLIGIYINRQYRIWAWMDKPNFYPFFIVLLLACAIIMVVNISNQKLIIFYLAFISALISLFFILKSYVGYIKK
jgi:membrane-associated phospholipid phosphatase